MIHNIFISKLMQYQSVQMTMMASTIKIDEPLMDDSIAIMLQVKLFQSFPPLLFWHPGSVWFARILEQETGTASLLTSVNGPCY